MLTGFREFITRGNVVNLAVAVVVGAAFGAIVTALVADIITPLIAAIGGQPDFSRPTFTINKRTFRYGALLNAVISFLVIAAAIYFLVVLPLSKIAERRSAQLAAGQLAEDEPQAKAEDLVVLEQIRDLLIQQSGSRSITDIH